MFNTLALYIATLSGHRSYSLAYLVVPRTKHAVPHRKSFIFSLFGHQSLRCKQSFMYCYNIILLDNHSRSCNYSSSSMRHGYHHSYHGSTFTSDYQLLAFLVHLAHIHQSLILMPKYFNLTKYIWVQTKPVEAIILFL